MFEQVLSLFHERGFPNAIRAFENNQLRRVCHNSLNYHEDVLSLLELSEGGETFVRICERLQILSKRKTRDLLS
jgi:hypothetical protein